MEDDFVMFMGSGADPTPSQTTINSTWSSDEAILAGATTSAFSNIANAATTLSAPNGYALFTTGSVADNGGNVINGNMAIGGSGYSLNGARIGGTLYLNTGITGSSNGTYPTGGTVVTSLASAISNVGANGAAFGVGNDSVLSVMTLLTNLDNLDNQAKTGQSVNGVLTYQGNTSLQNMAVAVLLSINEFGDIV